MSNVNVRTITNHCFDARLVSLASWRQAGEIQPKNRGGPCFVLQEGYDPNDLRMTGRAAMIETGKKISRPNNPPTQ